LFPWWIVGRPNGPSLDGEPATAQTLLGERNVAKKKKAAKKVAKKPAKKATKKVAKKAAKKKVAKKKAKK
jgi:hypothetical protein